MRTRSRCGRRGLSIPIASGRKCRSEHTSTQSLDGKLALADDALSTFLVTQLDELANTQVLTQPLIEKVRRAISGLLPGGAPKLEAVAAELAMSKRTLQRQLSSADTNFAQLVDETRHLLAKELLAQRQRPVGEISFLLGFSEPSAFHRAFKRWTGTTPTRFRGG